MGLWDVTTRSVVDWNKDLYPEEEGSRTQMPNTLNDVITLYLTLQTAADTYKKLRHSVPAGTLG